MYVISALRLTLLYFCVQLTKHARGSVTTTTTTTEETVSGRAEAFSCAGKVIGGYYADVREKCQMFHVCTIGEKGEIRDIVFRCLNGTVFDQETRVCEREEEVNCPISVSFYYLNNDLYGPGIIPETANALKQMQGQTVRQKLESDTETPKPTTMDTKAKCGGQAHASLYGDSPIDCGRFHLCIPQPNRRDVTRSFVCAEDGHTFDSTTGLCSRGAAPCSADVALQIPVKEAEIFFVHILRLCTLFPKGTYMTDGLSGCQQYIQCPVDENLPYNVRTCEAGYLFSQKHQKCVVAENVVCSRDIFSLVKLMDLKTSGALKDSVSKNMGMKNLVKVKLSYGNINSIPVVFPFVERTKRALTFEDRNPYREILSGSLTNAAGIFSDHASVIEAQSPGNVVEGKIAVPKFPLKSDTVPGPTHKPTNQLDDLYLKEKNSPSVQPETSLEVNKTILNGATIEVSEIASPDHKGKVTITSVVPKLVRHNGNGLSTRTSDNHIPSPSPSIISNGRTKITLIGSSQIKTEETRAEGPSEEKAERSPSESETIADTVSGTDADTATTAVSEETTVLETAVTTEQADIQTTVISTSTRMEVPTTTTTTTPPTTTTTTTSTTTTTTTTTTTSTSVEPETIPSSQEDKVETNFTCKDKELEQFYPDIEKNCKLFHYCSPGFTENEVLDLTFACSNNTRFDAITNKCQDINTVVCGNVETTSTTSTTKEPTTTVEITSTSTTTVPPSTEQSSEAQISSTTETRTMSEAIEESTTDITPKSDISEARTSESTKDSDTEQELGSTTNSIIEEDISTVFNELTAETLSERAAENEAVSTVSGSSTTEQEKVDSSTIGTTMADSDVVTVIKTDKEKLEDDHNTSPTEDVMDSNMQKELSGASASDASVENDAPKEDSLKESPSTTTTTTTTSSEGDTTVVSTDTSKIDSTTEISNTESPLSPETIS